MTESKASRIIVDEPPEPPQDLIVPANIRGEMGDVLAWGDYRDSDSYIVGEDKKLIPNPDNAAAGYLSIPYEVTKHFKDSVARYSEIDVNDIDIRHDDNFIEENFGTLPQEWEYNLNVFENIVDITFPNKKTHSFVPGHDTAETIRNWFAGSEKPQANFIVSYEFKGNDLERFKAKHLSGGGDESSWIRASPRLPSSWIRESMGGLTATDSVAGKYRYEGPSDGEEAARAAICEFYEGFESNYLIQ